MNKERKTEVVVVSGLSGAGRSEVAKVMEDLGWYVVDNLPPQLIDKMLSLALSPGNLIDRIVLVMDARGGALLDEADKALEALAGQVQFRLVFLEADDEVLVQRFDATRRRHPLDSNNAAEGIRQERDLMRRFRERAELIMDTSDLNTRDLRKRVSAYFGGDDSTAAMKTSVISFGYKYGLPLDADVVFDVRFLPNPHWIDELRPFTGLDAEVRDYVLGQEETGEFLDKTKDLLAFLLPSYEEEGRHYLTIAVGCTGGRHRSVVLAERLAAFIRDKGFSTSVIHRDVERSPVAR